MIFELYIIFFFILMLIGANKMSTTKDSGKDNKDSVKFEEVKLLAIRGDVFAYRKQLQAIGCIWDCNDKVWLVDPTLKQVVIELLNTKPLPIDDSKKDVKKKSNLEITTDELYIYVRGSTFKVKDQLKELSGRWDNDNKLWYMPIGFESKVREVLKQL